MMQVSEAKDEELSRVLASQAALREEVATLRAMQVRCSHTAAKLWAQKEAALCTWPAIAWIPTEYTTGCPAGTMWPCADSRASRTLHTLRCSRYTYKPSSCHFPLTSQSCAAGQRGVELSTDPISHGWGRARQPGLGLRLCPAAPFQRSCLPHL